MAAEDASLQGEVDEQIASVEERLAALEEQRLFSGPYDAGDALVSVNAGAGGTDAQDWAEMVLRMEMRWAERRGFEVELLEVEPGRGSGHQVGRPSAPPARTPTGCSAPSAACTGWCACRRSTPPTAARRASPASRSRRSCEDTGEIEINDDDLQVDTYRASGRGRPARQQDRLGRAHHPPADRDRGAVPERALAVLQPRDRDGDAAREAARAQGARTPGGDRAREGRGPGRQLRLADPLLRAAPVHDGQGPPHRPRDGRRAARARRRSRRRSCARILLSCGQPPAS